jgi:hypothetical protein
MNKIGAAVTRSTTWQQGHNAGKAGVLFEANPYKWAGGKDGMFRRAAWEAGWQAARRGERPPAERAANG